jgi:uncharacterized protein YjbI with pentapeptide repeats
MLKNLYGTKGAAVSQAELNAVFASQGQFTSCRGGVFSRLKGATLDGLNLANRNLREVDFSGTSLVGANLYGSNLSRASLYCADLRNCNLQNANLEAADLRGASFRGAKLSYAVLDRADLGAAMMMYVGPESASIVDRGDLSNDSAGDGGSVDFSNCRMHYTSFGNTRLVNVKFDGAIMVAANFKGAEFVNSSFRGAVLLGVNMKELKVPPEALRDCVMDVSASAIAKAAELRARLDAHQAWVASDGNRGAVAVLDEEDLRPLHKDFAGKNLVGLSARGSLAFGVDFSGCQLQGAKFHDADLRDANFSKADLSGASLKRAKLAHAKFDGANLCSLRLLHGGVVPPDLSEAEAIPEQFLRAYLDSDIASLLAGSTAR